jgi:hypothetical protein
MSIVKDQRAQGNILMRDLDQRAQGNILMRDLDQRAHGNILMRDLDQRAQGNRGVELLTDIHRHRINNK